MLWLNDEIKFPPYSKTTKHGIIALGGDLSAKRLIHAYQNGIFPWFSEQDPIIWYCPFRRMVLFPDEVKVSKSMKKLFRENAFEVTPSFIHNDVDHVVLGDSVQFSQVFEALDRRSGHTALPIGYKLGRAIAKLLGHDLLREARFNAFFL